MSLSSESIQTLYDRIGHRYDWLDFYESAAREAAIEGLALKPGQRVLNAGVGTGKVQSRLKKRISTSGLLIGLDLSLVMAKLAYQRSPGLIVMADVRNLPMASNSYDRIFAAYVFDLLPQVDLSGTAAGFRRILRPGGRVVLVSLTEGVDRWSRSLVRAWKWVYQRAPAVCGGCRPLRLTPSLEAAGLEILSKDVVVEWGVPSEVIIAGKSKHP